MAEVIQLDQNPTSQIQKNHKNNGIPVLCQVPSAPPAYTPSTSQPYTEINENRGISSKHNFCIDINDINDESQVCCCCCCVDVQTGALIIGILQLVYSIFIVMPDFFDDSNRLDHSIYDSETYEISIKIFVAILFTVPIALVIYANRRQKAWAYIPYLVIKVITIVLYFVVIIPILSKAADEYKSAILNSYIFAFIFLVAVEIWMWRIVYKAYRHMRDVLCAPALGNNNS